MTPFADGPIDHYLAALNEQTSLALSDEEKRESIHDAGWMALLFAPAFHFFRSFVASGGYKTGIRGFMKSGCESVAVLVRVAKRWEYRLWQRGLLKARPPVAAEELERFRK